MLNHANLELYCKKSIGYINMTSIRYLFLLHIIISVLYMKTFNEIGQICCGPIQLIQEALY